MRLNYGKTFVLGLGFMVISITWSVYNAFVPVFYERFVTSGTLIGLLMVTDNIIGITIQPWIAHRSDRTWTRWGRRMPYILVAAPVGAILFALIPLHTGLLMLLGTALGMNLAMGLYRAPTVALMPDLTPRPLRSLANGVINFMGGLGALIAFFVAAPLYRLDSRLPFALAAILTFVAVGILWWRIKEPRRPAGDPGAESQGNGGDLREGVGRVDGQTERGGEELPATAFLTMVRSIFDKEHRNALYLLLAIFAWFVGYQGLEAFFTLYGINVLGLDAAAGAFTLGFFALAFLVSAIPAGFIAGKLGRRRTITTGLALLILVFAVGYTTRSVAALRLLFLLGGLGWALVNVNSYPMVVEMADDAQTGAYTGLYYFFSSGAAIVGPPLMGLLRDLFGYRHLFLYAVTPVVVALLLISRVRGGEAQTPPPAAAAATTGGAET